MPEARRFTADPTSVAAARAWLVLQLDQLTPGALTDDAQLCLSELASNAVNHGGSGFEVEVDHLDDRLRITVSDSSDGQPILRSVDPRSTSGRGLLIVDAIALQWGVTSLEPTGKSVWCELDLPRPG